MGTAIVRYHRHDHPGCPSMPTRRTRLRCARDPSHPAGLPAQLPANRVVPIGSSPTPMRSGSPTPAGVPDRAAALPLLAPVAGVAGSVSWTVLQPVPLDPSRPPDPFGRRRPGGVTPRDDRDL